MQVKLKVLSGSHAGKEIKINTARFFIGRGEDCHLKPQSDLISRHHCMILVENGQVTMRDLKSRNGTIVNGEKIAGDRPVQAGDKIKVGPLEFELIIDHTLGGAKKPKVVDVKDAAAREKAKADAESGSIDADIGSWLEEAEQEDRSKRMQSPETRQFRFDSADFQALYQKQKEAKAAADAADKEGGAPAHDTAKQTVSGDTKPTDKKKKEKKEPGKLPKLNSESTKSSKEAAADMLKKFFNRK